MALVMVVMSVFFADERAANRAAHEICPTTHVARVDGQFRFACHGEEYAVRCEGMLRKECVVEPM
jgi:hypothetical protein